MNQPHALTTDPPTLLRQRYRLVAILGKGSLGTTYGAIDSHTSSDVVIKFIDPTYQATQSPDGAHEIQRDANTIPADIWPIIAQLLAYEPISRYPTSQIACEALARILWPATQLAISNQRVAHAVPNRATRHNLTHTSGAQGGIAAVEAERKYLANLLQQQLTEPLHLLLSQANAYEQSLSGQPMAQMAVSVLAALARQALQQLHDLAADLHPHVLETLGLVPALELLAGQYMRATNAHIRLILEEVSGRLPIMHELAVFRVAQAALTHAIRVAHATQITIRLEQHPSQQRCSIQDNGVNDEYSALVQHACERIEQLGGTVERGVHPHGGAELVVRFSRVEIPVLTPREIEVLRLITDGLSNKQIAARLMVSTRTINFHLDNIYTKLHVNSRTEASMLALRMGWIDQGTS